jgi:hypothetical protein
MNWEPPHGARRTNKMKNTGVNEKALDEFIGTVAAIEEKLDVLKAHVENHMDTSPEEINWGHVGSAKHLLQLIKEASEFAGIESAE